MAESGEYTAAVLEKHQTPLKMGVRKFRPLGHGECLVKITMSGVCHTDLHVQDADWEIPSKVPIILGHEGVGTVAKIGEGVNDLKIGDRVCIPWLKEACSLCSHCLEGWESVCPKVINSGYTADGAFAEYMYTSAAWVGRVPDGVSDEQAAPIACAGVTVYKALRQSCVRPGQWVAIVGASGGLGHVAVQYAIAMGMKVIGIDASTSKISYLKELGCDATLDVSVEKDIVKGVQNKTGGGVAGAIILVPTATAVPDAVRYTLPRGVIVPIALPPGDMSASTLLVIVKALRIQGSIVGTRQDLNEALRFAADGKVKARVEVRPFTQVNQALDDLRTGKVIGRLVLDLKK